MAARNERRRVVILNYGMTKHASMKREFNVFIAALRQRLRTSDQVIRSRSVLDLIVEYYECNGWTRDETIEFLRTISCNDIIQGWSQEDDGGEQN